MQGLRSIKTIRGAHLNGFIILADAATAHPDQTFSLLRGGIGRVYAPRNAPPNLRASLLLHIICEPRETGRHTAMVTCVNEQQERITDPFQNQFEVPQGGSVINLVVNIQIIFPRLGRFNFVVEIDGRPFASWPVIVEEA